MPHNANRRTYLRPSGPRHNVILNAAKSKLTWKRIPSMADPAVVAAKGPRNKDKKRLAQAREEPNSQPLTYNPFEILKELL